MAYDGDFYALPAWAVDKILSEGFPSALAVLAAIVKKQNRRVVSTEISIKELSEAAGVSLPTTYKTFQWLEDNKMLKVSQGHKRGYKRIAAIYPDLNIFTKSLNGLSKESNYTQETSNFDLNYLRTKTGKTAGRTPLFANTIDSTSTSSFNNRDIESGGKAAGSTSLILGADENDDSPTPLLKKKKTKRPVSALTLLANSFLQHPKVVVSRNFDRSDKYLVTRTVKNLLNAGVPPVTVSEMIQCFFLDEFYVTSTNPAKMFASKKVQDKLLQKVSASEVIEHFEEGPTMNALYYEGDRTSCEFAWGSEHDKDFMRLHMLTAYTLVRCYPEIFAQVVDDYLGDFKNSQLLATLQDLETVVKVRSGDKLTSSTDYSEALSRLSAVNLPEYFLIAPVRHQAHGLREAVFNYRRDGYAETH